MAILPIRTFGDPVLRQPARPIEKITDVHRRLIDDMLDTMREAPGVGLAGPQVGVMERLFVWEYEGEHGAYLNPRIVSRSDEEVEGEEGCLSVPGLYLPVMRAERVTLEAWNEDGEEVSVEAEGWLARILQHETDHVDGVLFLDRLDEGTRREALRVLRERMLGLAGDPMPRDGASI